MALRAFWKLFCSGTAIFACARGQEWLCHHNRRKSRRGAALMMVMVILALLLVLAVSFTFLMSQQEGTSVASLGGEQTRIITRTGADHAYARLNARNRLNQFNRWYNLQPEDVTHGDNPFVDWEGEYIVDLLADFEGYGTQDPLFPGLLDDEGNPLFRIEDPRRRVLGVNVMDESGKVNLNAATVGLTANLIGSSWVSSNQSSTGGVYEQIVLEDASFLEPYDQRGDSRTRGGGYVVIDHQLFSYNSRTGNVLQGCTPNPVYNSLNALFAWRSPGREIQTGEFVTTPTAYKIAFRAWLESPDGATPAVYDNIGEVRSIAETSPWFPANIAFGPEIDGQRINGWPEGLDPVTYQWLQENASTVAPTERFDSGWHYPHVVTFAEMQPLGESGKSILHVRYDNVAGVPGVQYVPFDPRSSGRGGIGRDNIVRLRRLDSEETHLGWVLGSGGGVLQVCVNGEPDIDEDDSAWIIECREKAEININSANFDTLVALFHGVGPRGQSAGNQPIRRADAQQIAAAIRARTTNRDASDEFEDLDDLLNFLRELSQQTPAPINVQQINLFARMQRYPYAPHGGVVTARVRFSSLNTYMVDAFATRYQPAGGAMARDAFREWVHVGSDALRTWRWRTYRMMQEEMRVPQGNIFELHAAGTENGRMTGLMELPYLRYDSERLQRPWRAPPWSEPTTRNINSLASGSDERFFANVQDHNDSITGGGQFGDLEAGMFSFWYRPHWGNLDGNHFLFDTAEQDYSNRVSLLWWGDRRSAYNMAGEGSGLTFRIKDRTLEEGYVELKYPLDGATWREREWYHMALNWKGTELSHLSLLLDGDSEATGGGREITPEVSHTFRQANGAWVKRTSTLQEDLEDPRNPPAPTEMRINPDDIDAFPDRGVVVIGGEAIEYTGKTGFALQNIVRGARGTSASSHSSGARVTVFGYTSPIREYPEVRMQTDPDTPSMEPLWPELPATSGNLTTNLGPGTIYRLNNPGASNANYYRPEELGPDAGLPAAGASGNPNRLRLNNYNGLPQQGVVAIYGMSWRGYLPPGTEGIPEGGVSYPDWLGTGQPPAVYPPPVSPQLAYLAYDGISSSGLNIIARYDADFQLKPESEWRHYLGEFDEGLFDGNLSATQEFWSHGACVMLCSIPVSSVQGYHERSVVQIDSEWMFYNVKWDTGAANRDAALATATGMDDHLFDTLVFVHSWTMLRYVNGAVNQHVNGGANPFGTPWRGTMNTTRAAHTEGTPVVPTFGTTATTGEGDIVTVVRDKNRNKEQRRIVTHRPLQAVGSSGMTMITVVAPSEMENYFADRHICALDFHVRATYPANRRPVTNDLDVSANNWRGNGGNLCKFPTGELPVELPTQWTFAGADPRTGATGSVSGASAGDFDSFEFRRYTRGNFQVIQPMTGSTPGEGGEIYVNAAPTRTMGVIRIDEEMICYRGVGEAEIDVWNPDTQEFENRTVPVLRDITRGILGSPVTAHAGGAALDVRTTGGGITGGTPIMNMASLRAGYTRGGGAPSENRIRAILGEENFRDYGFLRIEDGGRTEVVGYQRYEPVTEPDPNNNDQPTRFGTVTAGLLRYPNHPQALFRGAYGTQALAYSERALFFDQPVRFPDWFPGYHEQEPGNLGPWHNENEPQWGIPGAASPEISHIQGAATFRNADFHEFRWRIQYAPLADMARHSDAIGARLVVRFKQRGRVVPGWESIPTNAPGGLYAFEFSPAGMNTEDLGATLYEQTEDFTQGGTSRPIRADRIEWRVYFYFKRNAFVNEDYKTTLQFQGAEVDVEQKTRVVRHEKKR